MLFGCGCLIAMLAAFAPRLVLIFAWIWSARWDFVWAGKSFIWPLLGFICAPYTTIMYILVWNIASGVSGWDWLWIGMGVLLDIMKWGQIAANRREVPGYPEGAF
jgi:hypothetical protein